MYIDKNFKPIVIEYRKFEEEVKGNSNQIIIAIKRNDDYTYYKKMNVYKDGINDKKNIKFVERMVKSILWVVGGYEIYIYGSTVIANALKDIYKDGGERDFDYHFMANVYNKEFKVIDVKSINELPKEKNASLPIGGFLNGKRIGFDAGGSDRKVSAVVDGNSIYSEETIWFPKTNTDPQYHIDGIYDSFKTAIDKMGGDVDAIGVSSAGIYINNQTAVASLFNKIGKEDFDKYIRTIYIDITKKFEEQLGHKIPIVVANDGDVTALAGAMDLKDNGVLGIAMGTSEAGGYVDLNGNLLGWLSELAFVPVDLSEDAMQDEWSFDYGVGCKYFSQDAVIKLATMAGIKLDDNLSLAEKLKYVQGLANNKDKTALNIFRDIGEYLAYALAYYFTFYEVKHVLILGRVTSGIGGDLILETANKVLKEKFKEYKDVTISMPSEYMRRVGQSIAAASLAK